MKRYSLTTGTNESIWEAHFRELIAFRKKHGHARVPVRFAGNPRLGFWLSNQRQTEARGKLLPERRAALRRVGVVFDIQEAQWNASFAALVEFKRRHGHTRVPRHCRKPHGLGGWVARQRHLFHTGKIPEKYRQRLDEMGFDWHPGDFGWRQNCARLAEFRKVHGHCNVTSNTALGQWVGEQRNRQRQGELAPEQIKQLDAFGFHWVKPFVFGPELEACWRKRVRALKAFKKKHGHCQVSQPEHRRYGLGVWVSNVRTAYHRGKLREDRIRELDALGFAWKPENLCWEGHFVELAAFKRRHGHCRVPQLYAANLALGAFVAAARQSRRAGTLNRDQIRRLDGLGFVWEPMKSTWNRRFDHSQVRTVAGSELTDAGGLRMILRYGRNRIFKTAA